MTLYKTHPCSPHLFLLNLNGKLWAQHRMTIKSTVRTHTDLETTRKQEPGWQDRRGSRPLRLGSRLRDPDVSLLSDTLVPVWEPV